MRYFKLLLLIIICGCAPTIQAAGPRSVTLNRDFATEAEAQKVADAHCAQYNRYSRLNQNNGNGTISYDCVE